MSDTNLDLETVKKVANLARIELGTEEERGLLVDLEKIIGFFDQISEVDTKGVEPLITPSKIDFFSAEDEVVPEPSAPESFLNQAPDRQGNLYKVPSVL